MSTRGNGGVLCGLVGLAEHGYRRRHINHCTRPGGLAVKGTGSVAAPCLSFPILKVRSLHLPMGQGHATCLGRRWCPVRASAPSSPSGLTAVMRSPLQTRSRLHGNQRAPLPPPPLLRQSHPHPDDADAPYLLSSLLAPQQPASLSKILKMPQAPSQQESKPRP